MEPSGEEKALEAAARVCEALVPAGRDAFTEANKAVRKALFEAARQIRALKGKNDGPPHQ